MTAEAETLEDAARDAIEEHRLDAALDNLAKARALRATAAGADHPDLIWTVSLMIDAHLRKHTPVDAATAAALGEQRLTLRRRVLAEAPDELARSLRDLARLYVFENAPFDPARIRALDAEARALSGPEA